MKLSEKRRDALRDAIYDPILEIRISPNRTDIKNLHTMLYRLTDKIWQAQKAILKLED